MRKRYRASRSQPAQREEDEPTQHHQAHGQQAEQKDVAAECSHRDISHAGGSEGTASKRFGVALYPSAQSGNNPRKNGQAAPGSVGVLPTQRRRFAVTASQKAARRLANIVKERHDSEFEVVDLRDDPMPFFEEERSPMSAPPKSAIRLLWSKSVAPMLQNLVWWAKVLKASRQPGTHPIAVRS